MSNRAKVYITAILILGAAVVFLMGMSWRSSNYARLWSYLAVTMLAATWKVRLPGLTGTISCHFLFVVAAFTDFSMPETIMFAWRTGAVLLESQAPAKTRSGGVQ